MGMEVSKQLVWVSSIQQELGAGTGGSCSERTAIGLRPSLSRLLPLEQAFGLGLWAWNPAVNSTPEVLGVHPT